MHNVSKWVKNNIIFILGIILLTLFVIMFNNNISLNNQSVSVQKESTEIERERIKYENAPTSDFIKYNSISVSDTEVGDDLFYAVCRTSSGVYTVKAEVYINRYDDNNLHSKRLIYDYKFMTNVQNGCTDNPYAIDGSKLNLTEGDYKLTACYTFTVKYNIQKTGCTDSNMFVVKQSDNQKLLPPQTGQ